MPEPSFTFRCPGCSRLLGSSRSRAGDAVDCPRCGTTIVVPTPPTEGPRHQEPGGRATQPVTTPAPESGSGTGESPLLLNIQFEQEPLSLRPAESARRYRIPDARGWSPSGSSESGGAAPGAERVVGLMTPDPESASGAVRTLAPAAPAPPRRSDVVMPRTALVLWSFIVLLAILCSFAAGLLAGHFLWTAPIPSAPAGIAAPGR